MATGGNPGQEFDPALLSKADALIRRNRPDGVNTDAEELPLLTEAVDDIPELTDALDVPATAPRPAAAPRPGDVPVLLADAPAVPLEPSVMDLESEEVEDIDLPADGSRAQVVIGISHEQVDVLIREAMEQARQETLQEHHHIVQEAVERARAESKLLQARAVQAALAQGREEALASQTEYLRAVHAEAVETAMSRMSEHLIELDAHIAQALDAWVSRELPQIVAGELDSLVDRVRVQTTAHMRATLLPELSEKLSALLDQTSRGAG